jgi:hypothetical protein
MHISDLVFSVLTKVLGFSPTAWWMFQFTVQVGLLVSIALIDKRTKRLHLWQQSVVLFAVFATSLFFCWLPNIVRHHLTPDEAQWISEANGLVADPRLWIQYFLPVNALRVLTIVPLAALSFVSGGGLGYEGARCAVVLMWALFCTLLFLALTPAFGRQTATWSGCAVVLLVSCFSYWDFVAYNSELPVIVLCMGSLACFMNAIHSRSTWRYAAAGFLLACIPFAKHQGVPLAVTLAMCFLGAVIVMRGYRNAFAQVAGIMTGMLLLLLPLFLSGTFFEMLKMLSFFQEYSSIGFGYGGNSFIQKTLNFRMMLVREQEIRPLLLGSLVMLPILLWCCVFAGKRWKRRQIFLLVLASISFAAAAFSAWFPGHPFHRYALLMVFPASLVLGGSLYLIFGDTQKASWNTAFVFTLICLLGLARTCGHDGVTNLARSYAGQKSPLTEKILQLSMPGDRLLLWALWPSYLVETGLLSGARMLYPQFAVGPYKTAPYAIAMHMQDLEFLRPRFIVEWAGDDAIYFKDPKTFGIEAVPEIHDYVKSHYQLVAVEGNQKLYVRRNGSDSESSVKPSVESYE